MTAASDAASAVQRREQAARIIASQVELSPAATEAYIELLLHTASRRIHETAPPLLAPEIEEELTSAGLAGRSHGVLLALPVSQAYRRVRTRTTDRDAALRASVRDFQAHYANRFDHMSGVTVFSEGDPTSALVETLLTNAKKEVLALERGDLGRGVHAEASAQSVRYLRERGVRVRAVVRSSAMTDPEAAERISAASGAGSEVRQHPDMPLSMLIIDGICAVIDLADPDDAAPGGVVPARAGKSMTMLYTEAPEMTFALERTFASFWGDSTPLGHVERGTTGTDEAQIIALLAQGFTDSSIAARLGISPKTVSRRVSVLMEEFRVHTRLQLGAELARRGMC